MYRITITLKDGTTFEYKEKYVWGFDLDDCLRKGEQFVQIGQSIIRIDCIYYITWVYIPEEKHNESNISD